MENNGVIVFGRHGEKYKDPAVEGKKMVSGGFDDKNFVYVTEQSGAELRKKGKTLLGDIDFVRIISLTSDFIRTVQSTGYFLEGSSHNLKDKAVFDRRELLGYGVRGWDMDDPRLPEFGYEQEVADNYIKGLFENFFFRNSDPKLPCVAEWTHAFITSIIDGVKHLQAEQDKKGKNLLTHFTHGPNIDCLANVALQYLLVDPKHKTAEVDTSRFLGHVPQAELFSGSIYDIKTDNPSIALLVKDNEVGYKLTDLIKIQKEFYVHMRI